MPSRGRGRRRGGCGWREKEGGEANYHFFYRKPRDETPKIGKLFSTAFHSFVPKLLFSCECKTFHERRRVRLRGIQLMELGERWGDPGARLDRAVPAGLIFFH